MSLNKNITAGRSQGEYRAGKEEADSRPCRGAHSVPVFTQGAREGRLSETVSRGPERPEHARRIDGRRRSRSHYAS